MGKPLPNELVLQIGLYFGIGGLIIFLLLHGYKRRKPDLLESINVMISTAGIFLGIEFGRVALFAKPTDLGLPANDKVPRVIGALAIIWRSVEGLKRYFAPICAARRNEPPQDSIQ
jgi:hypothetical protein